MENKIARIIRKTAIVLLVLGIIGSFVLAGSAVDVYGDPEFSFSVLLQSLMVTALGVLLLIGFSEVIELLEKAAQNTRALLFHVTAIYKDGGDKPDLCENCGAPLPNGCRVCPNCYYEPK